MHVNHTIHLIDDDPAILSSLSGFLQVRGFTVQTHSRPADFLEAAKLGISGCILTDVYMPDMTGFELVAKLVECGRALPTIFMTAHADMSLRAEASRLGAVDILEKPFKNRSLMAAIYRALNIRDSEAIREPSNEMLQTRFSSLTASEKEILRLLVELRSNQSVARNLAISVRELERRRAAIMSKMHATTIADLVSFWSTVAASYQSSKASRR